MKIENIKAKFIDLLKNAYKPVMSYKLERALRVKGETLRQIKHNLICQEGARIGSNANGYFYIRTLSELNIARQNLIKRRNSLDDLIEAYNQIEKEIKMDTVEQLEGRISEMIAAKRGLIEAAQTEFNGSSLF